VNQTKKRIIQASAKLFVKKGCKTITMDDIATTMGISKRTIYENFSDKEDLLTQSMEYLFQQRKELVHKALQSSENIIEAMFQSTQSHTEFMKDVKFDFFNELQKYFPAVYNITIQRFKQENYEISAKMLEKGQADGVFRNDIDAELIAVLMQGINNMILTQEVFAAYNYNKLQLITIFNYNYIRGIATEKGLKVLDKYLTMYIEKTKKLS